MAQKHNFMTSGEATSCQKGNLGGKHAECSDLSFDVLDQVYQKDKLMA